MYDIYMSYIFSKMSYICHIFFVNQAYFSNNDDFQVSSEGKCKWICVFVLRKYSAASQTYEVVKFIHFVQHSVSQTHQVGRPSHLAKAHD